MLVWEDYMIIYFLAYIFIIVSCLFKFKKNKTFLLFFSIMYLYLLVVLQYTLFPIPYDEITISVFSEGVEWHTHINLIPFFEDSRITFSQTMLLNIVLTIPLGFGINFLFSKKLRFSVILLVGLLSGFLIELSQALIGIYLGFPYRVIDITDLICNLLGCLVGYIAFLIFARVWVFLSKYIHTNNKLYKSIDYICNNNIVTEK